TITASSRLTRPWPRRSRLPSATPPDTSPVGSKPRRRPARTPPTKAQIPMFSPFHEGERAVQERVGVRDEADQVGRIVGNALGPPLRVFIRRQRLAILAGLDGDGNVWASPLTGPPGFLHALDDQTVQIEAPLPPGDPLAESARDHALVGLLVIDLAN